MEMELGVWGLMLWFFIFQAEQRLLVVGTHMWRQCWVAVSCWWLEGTVAGLVGI